MSKKACIYDDLNSKSYWLDSTGGTNYPILESDIKVDVAVIGGGITGITTAFLLKKEGIKVALFEADGIVQGTTGHTTAYVTSQHDLIYNSLIESMGKEKAKQYADANEGAIDFIENMVKKYDIDCDFLRLPAYAYTTDKKYVQDIKKEVLAARSLGIKADFIEKLDLPFSIEGAVRFDNQAQFHPRKYLLKIAEKIPGNKSKIYEHTRIVDIEKNDDIYTLVTDTGFKIVAEKVVLASHFPFYDGMGLYFAKLRPQRSYVITAQIKDKLPQGTFVEEGSGGYYFRNQRYRDSEMLIIGGQGHRTANSDDMIDRYTHLREYAKINFNVEKFLYVWSTQDYVTIDGIPYVGRLNSSSKNIYVATGYGEWGMTNGTAAANIIKDLIVSNKSPYEDVYNPSRSVIHGIKNLVKENFDVAEELIKGKFGHGEYDIDLKNDEAKTVEIKGNKYGAYRDKNGKLHLVDITCTHLGCELKWNSAEKSWDCPCHGSRFTFEGDIIEGPAVARLNYYKCNKNTIDSNI
ncbi:MULTISPECIES: FAD-dependent oxidoreductase [Clostridium]|uniref:FAD-dependent oxidoreductase n=1 Tax=Clostridium TaxID=1485 RepID=UPI000824BE70|nr:MULTISPECIES: FAD-dependent oxidoreductase [Clostridium]PJI06789.1 (2Fe-2S)-binding protein [Clostridium sp. CT7]